MDHQTKPPEKLAYHVNEASHVSGLGRTTLYELFKTEKLKTVKAAGRRLVMREDLEAYLRSCRDDT